MAATAGNLTVISRAASIMAAPIPRLAFLWASCFSWMNEITMVLAFISTIATLYVVWQLFKNRSGVQSVSPSSKFERWINFIVKNI